jgi:hypothetical protein
MQALQASFRRRCAAEFNLCKYSRGRTADAAFFLAVVGTALLVEEALLATFATP